MSTPTRAFFFHFNKPASGQHAGSGYGYRKIMRTPTLKFGAAFTRDWRDTRLGFVLGTDAANVFDDDVDNPSRFHISGTLCLLWVNVKATLYL